jgi:hypothetical protein
MPVDGAGCKWTEALAAYVSIMILVNRTVLRKGTRLRLRPYRLAPHYEPGRSKSRGPRLWRYYIDVD